MFPAEAPVAPAEEAEVALRLLVLPALMPLGRTRVETVAAEPETPVDLARKRGRLPEAVRKRARQADGETRLLEFAAAVPLAAEPLVQWLWKPA
jgi:hypothetical protein